MLIRFPLIIVAAASVVLGAAPQAQPDLVARARAIHDRVITLDTHNDIDPQNFTADCNYTMRLTTQVNLPKMKEGGLDASFFIVYVGQGDADAGRLRCGLSSGDREVRRHPPAHRADRAERDRAGADAGRRAADRQEREEGGDDRRRERLSDRHRHQAREGVLRSRRPLHVASRTTATTSSPTRTPARRATNGSGAACRRSARRSIAGDEPARHDGRRLAPVEGVDAAGRSACRGRR